jgi:type IV fimbrial biogenesis protein FimT
MSKSAPNASAGFTMTELVMTMAIVAILAAIGVPSFKYVTASNRIASEINGLLGDMQFARSQAVKEGQSVTVCVSTNGTSCTGGSAWQNGWIVFLDANFNQQVDVAAGEKIIRVQPPFPGTDTFVASSGAFTAITYNRMGYAPTLIAANITIKLHDSTNTTAWTRCLQITPIGTPTTEKYGAGTPACT